MKIQARYLHETRASKDEKESLKVLSDKQEKLFFCHFNSPFDHKRVEEFYETKLIAEQMHRKVFSNRTYRTASKRDDVFSQPILFNSN